MLIFHNTVKTKSQTKVYSIQYTTAAYCHEMARNVVNVNHKEHESESRRKCPLFFFSSSFAAKDTVSFLSGFNENHEHDFVQTKSNCFTFRSLSAAWR